MICSEAGIESAASQSMNILTRNAPGVKNKRSGAIEPRPAPPRAYEPCILWSLMKRAAGVDEVEDVIERFRTQGQTSEILATQNERAKDDVMKLSQTKEQLQSTWEKVRFAFDSSLNQLLFFIIIFQDTLVKVRT